MDRSYITEKLSDLLIHDRFSGIGKYWAREVVLDYGLAHPKRVDFLQYIPKGSTYVGEIENGTFACYEIKSCKNDVYSGHGLNFFAEENFIVTTVECYKSLIPDIQSGKLYEHIRECNDGKSIRYSFLIAVRERPEVCYPRFNSDSAVMAELEDPSPIEECTRLATIFVDGARKGYRIRSTTELLFCMLRSGK